LLEKTRWLYNIYYMSETNLSDEKLIEAKNKIEKILTEYSAALVPITLISGDKVLSRVDIVSVNKEETKSE